MHTKNCHTIALIGAGNIGSTLALLASIKRLGKVILIDIAQDLARAKALDIGQSSSLLGFDNTVVSSDYSALAKATVVIVTAGLTRKPGMQREDLVAANAAIIKEVGKNIREYAPNAFVILVTNPLDGMTWLMHKTTGFPAQKIVGMAGTLDTARFSYFVAQELNVSPRDVNAFILGSHGDEMVPLTRYSTVRGIPLAEIVRMNLLSQEQVNEIVDRTKHGGGEIVQLLQKGSAFYAPAAAALQIAEAYICDQKRLLFCSTYLTGQYEVKDLCIGVPVVIGSKGVERIIEVKLDKQEKELFHRSITRVKELLDSIKTCVS